MTDKQNERLPPIRNDSRLRNQEESSGPKFRITNLKQLEKQINQSKEEFLNNSKIVIRKQNSASNRSPKVATRIQSEEAFLTQGLYTERPEKSKQNISILKDEQFNKNEELNLIQQILSEGAFKDHKKEPKIQIYIYDNLSVAVKEFFQNKKDFLKILSEFDVANYCMNEVNQRVRCYRYELGNLLEKVNFTFQKIVEQMMEHAFKLHNDTKKKFENQIIDNQNQIEKYEKEKKQMEQEIRDLKNRYLVQESLLKITKINSDSLSNEIILLHEILRKDILNMQSHLEKVEIEKEKNIKQGKNDYSESLVNSLQNLKSVINSIEQEQDSKENMLGTMGGLIKAMLKGTKQDAFTQVDEAELQWVPNMVIQSKKQNQHLTMEEMEAMNVGTNEKFLNDDNFQAQNNKDLIQAKDKQVTANIQKKLGNNTAVGNSENWNIPVSMIIFLENVSKSNEVGRVIPWLHFRKQIYDIYNDKIANDWEMYGCVSQATMPIDEYICIYFLRIHKLRRVAELKLFEFLVSLRYYLKQWPRASLFSLLCNITLFPIPQGENQQHYKFDLYLQNFFFYTYGKLKELQGFQQDQDGATYLQKTAAIEFVGEITLVFGEQARQKITLKLEKLWKKMDDKSEYVDIDMLLDLFIEEYFEGKKRINKNLSKNFSKAFDTEHGVFSFDDMKKISKDVISCTSLIEDFQFPKEITLGKIFLFALTQSRNKFDINAKEFLSSIQKYGFDSPFPFIRTKIIQGDLNSQKNAEQVNNTLSTTMDAALLGKRDIQSIIKELLNSPDFKQEDLKLLQNHFGTSDSEENTKRNKQIIKVDSTSTLFAQHFSILRELRSYCKAFKDSMNKEENTDILWNEFNNILSIIEAGCQFLNFPINI